MNIIVKTSLLLKNMIKLALIDEKKLTL